MPLDSMGRRSRFKRTPTGKRMVPTARDVEILRWLYRYRYLSATQLIDILQPRSEKRFIERLGDLFHETGLIDRPPAQWRGFDARFRSIFYELSPKGIRYLADRAALPARATTLSRRAHNGRAVQFDHATMIVDALLSVELETRDHPDQRFVPVDEILARAPENTRQARNPLAVPVTIEPRKDRPDIRQPWHPHIIPDALYGIEYLIDGERRYRFWALECENTTPLYRAASHRSSIARKEAAYEALISSRNYRTHWGIPNLRLRHVTANSLGNAG